MEAEAVDGQLEEAEANEKWTAVPSLVITDLQAKILCGAPFLSHNEIIQDLYNHKVIVDGKFHITEATHFCPTTVQHIGHSNVQAEVEKDPHKILKLIQVDENVPKKDRDQLNYIYMHNNKVFDGDLTAGYNNFSGDYTVKFNFLNNIPPTPNLGCVPTYAKREDDLLMQAKIDELERMGVVNKAVDMNIVPKYASPTLLRQETLREGIKKTTSYQLKTN